MSARKPFWRQPTAPPDLRDWPVTLAQYPKRLIEVDLPIRRISAHARREKSIRHGHISTLHIWWARRPLAACRAVICASLWPDTATYPAELIEIAFPQLTRELRVHVIRDVLWYRGSKTD